MSASDKFRAYGNPVMLIVALVLVLIFAWREELNFLKRALTSLPKFALGVGSVLVLLMSIMLFFTPAWPYALLMSLLAFTNIWLLGKEKHVSRTGFAPIILVVMWLSVLVGQMGGVGLVDSLSYNKCLTYYITESKTMCKEGWRTFTQILAMVMIGANFLIAMLVLGRTFTKFEREESRVKDVGYRERNKVNTHSPTVTQHPAGPRSRSVSKSASPVSSSSSSSSSSPSSFTEPSEKISSRSVTVTSDTSTSSSHHQVAH